MAQPLATDFPIDPTTTSGTALAGILNRFSDWVATTNAGATPPPDTMPGMLWLDTSAAGDGVLRLRNAANTAWITLIDTSNLSAPGRLLKVTPFTASAPFTPDARTKSVLVELLGGGGGGGGLTATAAAQTCASSGGGGGGYVKSLITSGFAGASVVVGAGGNTAVGTAGTNGGNSTFLGCTAGGGGGGALGFVAGVSAATPGVGGSASGGNVLNVPGGRGSQPYGSNAAGLSTGGSGGSSIYGAGGLGGSAVTTNTGLGGNATGFGSGGGGSASGASQGANFGSAGSAGLVLIYEYS